MRLKQLENQWRCYLNPHDYQTLRDHAESKTADLAIRLGGEVGLRVSESAAVRTGHVRPSTHPDVDQLFLSVYGKDTTGTYDEGKYRDAFLPEPVYGHMLRVAIENNAGPEEDLIPVTKRTTQEYVKRAALAAADATGTEEFEYVSSHDLRAYWATDCLIRRNMNVRVIMEVGGWNDYKSMQPYLNAAFDDVIAAEFVEAGVV